MAELTMNEIIHAAVRRDLARMEAALRAFPDGDVVRARELQRAWASLWEQLHHHHQQEDAHVWPYLRRLGVLDPILLDEMESEHQAMAEAMISATGAVDGLAAEPTAAAASRAADLVGEAARVTERHLVHEEKEVMPTVVEREDTPEWKAVEKEFRKAPPAFIGRMMAWVQDGADPEVRDALRSQIPRPVLFVFSRVLGRRYHREVAPVWR